MRAAITACTVAGSRPAGGAGPGRREVAIVAQEHPRDLDDEERVAAGVQRDPLGVLAFQAAGLHRQTHGVLGRERLDPQRGGVGQAAGPVGTLLQEVPARHADDDQRDPAGLLHELLDQVEQQRVRLLEVLEHQHHRAPRGEPFEEREHAAAHLGGLEAVVLAGLLPEAEREAEPPHGPFDLLGIVEPGLEQLVEPALDIRRGSPPLLPQLAITIWASGQNVTSSSNGLDRPLRTLADAGRPARNSSTTLLLPIPGSPSRVTMWARPRLAARS